MKSKKCTKCRDDKEMSLFHKRSASSDGRDSRCKECKNAYKSLPRTKAKDRERLRGSYPKYKDRIRNNFLKRTYGITSDQYDAMLSEQEGVCKICKRECSSGRSLAVDHDHKTGKIRGLLCSRCNRGIGYFVDNPHFLVDAASYLGQNQ